MASTVRPKKKFECKLPPPPAPAPGPFKLFIRFPSDTDDAEDTRVHTITIESDSVAVTALKARIELLLGLPGKQLPLSLTCVVMATHLYVIIIVVVIVVTTIIVVVIIVKARSGVSQVNSSHSHSPV